MLLVLLCTHLPTLQGAVDSRRAEQWSIHAPMDASKLQTSIVLLLVPLIEVQVAAAAAKSGGGSLEAPSNSFFIRPPQRASVIRDVVVDWCPSKDTCEMSVFEAWRFLNSPFNICSQKKIRFSVAISRQMLDHLYCDVVAMSLGLYDNAKNNM